MAPRSTSRSTPLSASALPKRLTSPSATTAFTTADLTGVSVTVLARFFATTVRRRRSTGAPGDSRGVVGEPAPVTDVVALYDDALPHVYGYLLSRCGGKVAVAEDLTTQTFLGAVQAARDGRDVPRSRAWLMAVARNKLVDHWRRQAREERGLAAVAGEQHSFQDPWDAELDALRARQVLDGLGANHRMVLSLRYLDDLPVPEVARLIDRSVHATESLLVRARAAFRRSYEREDGDG